MNPGFITWLSQHPNAASLGLDTIPGQTPGSAAPAEAKAIAEGSAGGGGKAHVSTDDLFAFTSALQNLRQPDEGSDPFNPPPGGFWQGIDTSNDVMNQTARKMHQLVAKRVTDGSLLGEWKKLQATALKILEQAKARLSKELPGEFDQARNSMKDIADWLTGGRERADAIERARRKATESTPEPNLDEDIPAGPVPMDLNWKQKPIRGGLALHDSVGQDGINLKADVETVQKALNKIDSHHGPISGVVSEKMIERIRILQKVWHIKPDGLVEVGGNTSRKLKEARPMGLGDRPVTLTSAAAKIRDTFHSGNDPQALAQKVSAAYYDFNQNGEFQGIKRIVDGRFAKKFGAEVKTTEDMLEWIALFDPAKEEIAEAIPKILSQVKSRIETLESRWELDEQARKLGFGAVEWIGGVVRMVETDFKKTEGLIAEAKKQLAAGNYDSAATTTAGAVSGFEANHKRFIEFLEGRQKGAGRIVIGLTLVRDVSFTIVASAVTGGAVEALNAGIYSLGTVGTAAVEGTVAVGAALVKAGASYVGHVFAGTTEQFEIEEAFVDAIKDGIVDFGGGAITKWATGGLEKKLAASLARSLKPTWGARASDVAGKAVGKLFANGSAAAAQTIVTATVDGATGKTFKSSGEFFDYLEGEYFTNFASNVLGDIAEGAGEDDQQLVKLLEAAFGRGE